MADIELLFKSITIQFQQRFVRPSFPKMVELRWSYSKLLDQIRYITKTLLLKWALQNAN